jgi:predicted transcriptional regulator
MADIKIEVDDEAIKKKLDELAGKKLEDMRMQAVHDIATEILRKSTEVVPHDTGMLQNSGNVIDEKEQSVVGYNKVYAARLHEHPEYRFQKGRQGKWLQNTIQKYMEVFKQYYKDFLAGIIN